MNLLIENSGPPFLRSIQLRNYKSVGKCSVDLGQLTVLVGRNGSGKSNFLDALHFVTEGLQSSLDHAIKFRGGIDAVRRKSTGHPRNFAIELVLGLADYSLAHYGFEIAARGQGGFAVKKERLRIRTSDGQTSGYEVSDGIVNHNASVSLPPASPDRLYLVNAASVALFKPVYDSLRSMGFYNLNPDVMKQLQSPDAGELLHRDGSNIASVIARLAADEPNVYKRIRDFLGEIVPSVKEVERVSLGPSETLEFRQEVKGAKHPWKFYAANMSDGTLRALGALTAVTQLADRKLPVTLVGIEEPETALHPAAAGILVDALREASARTQVIVTTHSPDLLDQLGPRDDTLLVVRLHEGVTEIAPPDVASVEAIRSELYSSGELLRMDQLEPSAKSISSQQQMTLFADAQD